MLDKTVLITGAAGSIGSGLRRELRGVYRTLRLLDLAPIADRVSGEECLRGDVADRGLMREALAGVDAVVHLAGYPVEGSWEQVVPANVLGAIATWEAMREAGTRRVVYASTNHAVGFHPRARRIDHRAALRPDGRYGATKAFGELLASLFWDKHGIEALCIRIGNGNDRPIDRRRLSIWVSWRDLAQLVRIGVERTEIGFAVVYGVSDNARSWYDNAEAHRLGYRPQDRAEDHAAAILAATPEPDFSSVVERAQGGDFCGMEYDGDPTRPERSGY